MARKSRKQIAVEEPVVESVSSEVFSTAIYARLSVENSGKSEKVDVIANQIEICKSYIAERPYLNLIDTYVDNGRTGTVFDRPEFNRLMNDIRTGRIKCLVVRDLSRFGRDYIEAGTYLERVFPQIGLRFMTRRKNKAGIRYFQCIHSVNNGNTDCPVGRSFPEMDIEKVVFHALTQFLALAQKEAIQNREVGDLRKSAIKECADKIRTLQKQNEQNKASKLRLYEKYAAGSITKEAYIQQKAAADVKIAENDGAIQRSHERMKELDSETACSDEKLDAVCEQYADCKALTYELTHAFISAVYIYDLDNIEIVWKFKDFLTTSEGEAK